MEIKQNSIEAKNLACGYGGKAVITELDFVLNRGEILCILGPNGSGKTTLFKTLLGFLPPLNGEILAGGENIKTWSRKKLAEKIAYVPQAHTPPFPYTVEDVILMGRTVRFDNHRNPQKKDYEKADEIMSLLGIGDFKYRLYTQISGGERQLVLIARALAQEPEFLIMDEPASSLDFGNQMRLLKHIISLKETGAGILMTSHHPDHVFLCASRVMLIREGKSFAAGTCDKVLTEENLKAVYGIDIKVISTAAGDGRIIRSCIADFS
ncbi:ABC transporter ATP-binding protein [Leadbettera azotonutricia]|uniref:Hemin import ATP-binding protein HmuV n=1 Tax=Leadbettera azotonutricia (strain ATCC BAA-888 / DSM 13862 / ZAS-9) TaxID=545695 RepID=F5Y731_LEAAZ|nr:ABC transporter ATP-binding protein [Leadbettera azotonutricia]AEF81437.1 hemin import ATP-binding protein HmuV [Leadbettera azotonutricia ZAS-9]